MSLFSRISCSSILPVELQSFGTDAALEQSEAGPANLRDPEVVQSLEPIFDGERVTLEMERSCPPLLEIGDDEIPFYHSNAESMIDFPKFYFDSSFCSSHADSTPSKQDRVESIAAFVCDHRSSNESLFVDTPPASITTDLPPGLSLSLLLFFFFLSLFLAIISCVFQLLLLQNLTQKLPSLFLLE